MPIAGDTDMWRGPTSTIGISVDQIRRARTAERSRRPAIRDADIGVVAVRRVRNATRRPGILMVVNPGRQFMRADAFDMEPVW